MNYPQNGFPPAPQPNFQPPQYTQPYNPPAQAPQYAQPQPGPAGTPAPSSPQPLRGSLSQGWDQGARAGGYGNAARWPSVGHRFTGIVARDMTDADCRQATDPGTKQPKFFRKSGAPQFEFVIAVDVQPSPEYPEGKATVFTSKYRLHQAVVRAMQEQGYQPGEGLHAGDQICIDRIADVQSGMGQPGHDFVAYIQRGSGSAPVQQASAPAPVEYAAPVAFPTESATAPAPSTAPATPAAPVTAASVPSIPGLTPEQAALVAQYGVQGNS